MIKNERECRITQVLAQKFQQALAQMQANSEKSRHQHPALRQAEQDALQSRWESLQAEISDYEARK